MLRREGVADRAIAGVPVTVRQMATLNAATLPERGRFYRPPSEFWRTPVVSVLTHPTLRHPAHGAVAPGLDQGTHTAEGLARHRVDEPVRQDIAP